MDLVVLLEKVLCSVTTADFVQVIVVLLLYWGQCLLVDQVLSH